MPLITFWIIFEEIKDEEMIDNRQKDNRRKDDRRRDNRFLKIREISDPSAANRQSKLVAKNLY